MTDKEKAEKIGIVKDPKAEYRLRIAAFYALRADPATVSRPVTDKEYEFITGHKK